MQKEMDNYGDNEWHQYEERKERRKKGRDKNGSDLIITLEASLSCTNIDLI